MKILVTGANGYLGQGIIKKLLDDGINVIATDFEDNYIDKRAEIRTGNIFCIEEPFQYFGKPDAVLHLAWRDGFKHNSESHLIDLPKHYSFLRAMAGGVKKICVLGSMHEVGFYEGSIDESTPTNPQSLYGIGKNSLRNATRLLCDEKNIIFQWIRGFYIVGNTEHGCSIFSKITAAEKNGQKLFPFTSGQNQYDFIDYNVFCEQVASVVEQNAINGIINCCSGMPEKLSDRVERFIKDNGYRILLQYGAFPERPYDSKAVWGNDSKIQMVLNNKHFLTE